MKTTIRKRYSTILLLFLAGMISLGFVYERNKKKLILTGIASYYSDWYEGRITSNGEVFRQNQLTAASKDLKFGTMVKVTNLKNDSTVIVRINDRMPKTNKRLIDLSFRAATQLNFIRAGLAKVTVEILEPENIKN